MRPTSPARHLYWRACRERTVWRHSVKVGLTFGLIQAALNQGDHWIHHGINTGVIVKSILSPLLSFSVAFVGATAAQSIYYLPQSDFSAAAFASRAVEGGSTRGYGTLQTMSATEMMVDEAAVQGKDLVGDMVRRLKRDILVARNRLEAIQSVR